MSDISQPSHDNRRKIISEHIFLLPFTIENNQGEKCGLEDIGNALNAAKNSKGDSLWSENHYTLYGKDQQINAVKYNTYYYFYPYVRDLLFPAKCDQNNCSMKHFSCKIESDENKKSDAKFIILPYGKGSPYQLDIRDVSLRLFDTGIGILGLNLLNKTYSNIKDVNKINGLGRRIYPPFLAEDGITGTKKNGELPEMIKVVFEGFEDEELFDIVANNPACFAAPQEKCLPPVANYIKAMTGPNFCWDNTVENRFFCQPIIDDRMFVICWFGSDIMNKELRQVKGNRFVYEDSDDWYQFLFLDSESPTCSNPDMKQELIRQSSYRRWISRDSATFYGISRYSLVCLSDTSLFSYFTLRKHMTNHYTQMFFLLLSVRASILKFHRHIYSISHEAHLMVGENQDKTQIESLGKKVADLHARYIKFRNRFWFREITPQDQGIEMYTQALKCMELSQDMDELQKEIKELYEFLNLVSTDLESKDIKNLTSLGAVFLPLGAATGLFGIIVFLFSGFDKFLPGVILFILLFLFAFYVTRNILEKRRQVKDLLKLKTLWGIIQDFIKNLLHCSKK